MALMFKKKLPDSDDRIYPDHPTNTRTFNSLRRMDLYEMDGPVFKVLEPEYYHAAKIAAARNDTVPDGEIREIKKRDPLTNHVQRIEFYGQEHFTKFMGRPGRRVVRFRGLVDHYGRPM
jgi:hypothetical protein